MVRLATNSGNRRGGIALAALIALPVVLLAFVVGLSSRTYRDIHTRMQIEADATALAGMQSLTGDEFLRGRLTGMNDANLRTSTLETAYTTIQDYAKNNPVFGNHSVPDWNTTTPLSGDIVFGIYDRMTPATPFTPVAIGTIMSPGSSLHRINSVKVYMRRSHDSPIPNPVPIPHMPIFGKGTVDASTVATAMLDDDIQGFRPLFSERPVPLMPIALKASTVNGYVSGMPDVYRFDSTTKEFSGPTATDGLPEITIELTTATPPSMVTTSAMLLNIGYTGIDDMMTQVTGGGVKAAQLTGAPFNAYGNAFLLQKNDMTMSLNLEVPARYVADTAMDPTEPSKIKAALDTIAVKPFTPRIWPLYELDGMGQPIIVGFIAARVAAVQVPNTDASGTSIQFTLQPTFISEPSAVTNVGVRGYVGVPNLTIAKLRLVP